MIEAYILSSAKEKRIGFRGLKGEEDDSQEDEKSRSLVNGYVLGHADKSLIEKVIFCISLLLVQPLDISSCRQLRGR